MPAYPSSVVRVVINMGSENSPKAYVFHYEGSAGHQWTVVELQNLASAFFTQVDATWRSAHATLVNMDSITATAPGSTGAPQGTYFPIQPHAGTVVGDMLPANCATVISWKTGSTLRSARGRTFMFGAVDTAATGSTATPTYLGLLANFANALGGFHNAGGPSVNFVVYSRLVGLSTDILAFVINAIMDSQRRRLPGRGV